MLDAVVRLIEESGSWIYVLAPLFMIVVAILPIPAEIPAMLNGMVFGWAGGVAVTWAGGLLGAVISFELARRYGRPLAERLVSRTAVDTVDRVALSAGWPALLTLRLVPTVAFTLLNWTAGLTMIDRWTFLWTTALGIVPGAIVFTISGTGLGALYRRNPSLALALGAVAVLVAVWTGIRYRRRARS